jgi:hypothetical protein
MLLSSSKNSKKKLLIPTDFDFFMTFYLQLQKVISKKFLVAILKVTDEKSRIRNRSRIRRYGSALKCSRFESRFSQKFKLGDAREAAN